MRLVIVGSDYPADSGTTHMLKEHARELGIGENVLFTGQRSDVALLLAACGQGPAPSGGASSGDLNPGVPAVVESPTAAIVRIDMV